MSNAKRMSSFFRKVINLGIKQNEDLKATIISVSLLAVVFISVIIAIFLFVSQNGKEKEMVESRQTENDNHYKPTEDETRRSNELANIIKNNLPQIDGTISTNALEAGIYAKILGKTQEQAEMGIYHTDGERAFNNLLSGKNDIIFSTSFTEDQEREAASKNIDLKVETVAREGMVFVVNANNPVESITQEQLMDIYSGKITNWKDVGGTDSKIEVFQNKEKSENQIFLNDFMKGTNIIDAKKEFLPALNSGIIEMIATYDNSENAIGCMTYKYPASMYENQIKYLKIDGIEPTKEKMTTGEYLLTRDIYAIYNTAKASTKTVDELVEWLLTYDGQVAMLEAGYVPVKNITVKENNIEKYTGQGTGKEQAELSNFNYIVDSESYNEIGLEGRVVGIQGLKDTELQDNINKFISEKTEKLREKENDYDKYVDKKPNSTKEGIQVETECKNGYLNVQVVLTYKIGQYRYVYDGYSAVYDLYNGVELTLSDLYYQGSEFVSVLNNQIDTIIVEKTGIDNSYIHEKRAFAGITNNVLIGLDKITFTNANPYFEEGVIFELDTYFENISVIYEERNMQDIWEENIVVSKELIYHEGNGSTLQRGKITKKETEQFVYYLFYMNTNNSDADKAINDAINTYSVDDTVIGLIQKLVANNPTMSFNKTIDNKYQITLDYNIYGSEYAVMLLTVNPKQSAVTLGTFTVNLKNGKKASYSDIKKWKAENNVE